MGNPFKGQPIPKAILVRAIEMNPSMRQAAASIHVSYQTFKKYAVIYDIWAPMKLQDISKIKRTARKIHWDGSKLLGMVRNNELMRKMILEGWKEQRCDFCGYNNYRENDLLTPLMVTFDNLDENDHTPENVKFYCYNCYFCLFYVKFKPTTAKLSAKKVDGRIVNRFTDQVAKKLDDKLTDIEESEADARKLGENMSAIFTRK